MTTKRYIEDSEPRYWYGARPHRFGYRRALTWEGWAFDVGLLITCIAIAPYVRALSHPWQSLALFFGVLGLAVGVRHFKGEPNRFDT